MLAEEREQSRLCWKELTLNKTDKLNYAVISLKQKVTASEMLPFSASEMLPFSVGMFSLRNETGANKAGLQLESTNDPEPEMMLSLEAI